MNTRRYYKFIAGIGTSLILLFLLVNSTKAAAGKTSIALMTNAGVLGEDRFTINNINTINNREGTITNLAPSTLNTDLNWSIQAADAPKGPTSFSLKLDSTGTPHIALGGDHLYYATINNGNWDLEVVDNAPGVGYSVSLVFDSNDRPHMAYNETSTNYYQALRYAYWNGTQWVVQAVSSFYSGGSVSIALDTSNRPQIAYEVWNVGLRYANWTGTQWIFQTIDQANCQASYISLVLDSHNTPYISYNCNGLRYATWTGTSWRIDVIDTNNVNQGDTSLALDSLENPHIAYYTQSGLKELRYVSWNGTSWDLPEVIDTNGNAGEGASLVIDRLNLPHISYMGNGRVLNEAKFNGSTWNIQTIPNTTDVGNATSQGLDSNGNAYVGYVTYSPLNFFYTKETVPGTWTTPQLVDGSSSAGTYASIAIDKNNHPHISTLDRYQNTLRYSTWDGVQWINQVVDTSVTGDHLYSSIQTDANNRPHIAYFGIGGLKYASWDGSQWQIQSLGVYGRYDSLALDKTTDYPRISFCSGGFSGGSLMYASWDGSIWNIQTIDSVCAGGDFGGETSLALDNNGDPHIAYISGTGPTFYTSWDPVNSQWVKQEVTGNEILDESGSLALDSSGIPHIAYCGYNGSDTTTAQYASWNGSSWDISVIDDPFPTTNLGCETISLALDSNNIPHVSYVINLDDSLRYVTWNGTGWSSQIVDTNFGWTGITYVPIAVGPDGDPWIAYANWRSADLMVAHGIPPYQVYLPLVIR